MIEPYTGSAVLADPQGRGEFSMRTIKVYRFSRGMWPAEEQAYTVMADGSNLPQSGDAWSKPPGTAPIEWPEDAEAQGLYPVGFTKAEREQAVAELKTKGFFLFQVVGPT
jgi:hypothetical protein